MRGQHFRLHEPQQSQPTHLLTPGLPTFVLVRGIASSRLLVTAA